LELHAGRMVCCQARCHLIHLHARKVWRESTVTNSHGLSECKRRYKQEGNLPWPTTCPVSPIQRPRHG
jgi:hypothetical protein